METDFTLLQFYSYLTAVSVVLWFLPLLGVNYTIEMYRTVYEYDITIAGQIINVNEPQTCNKQYFNSTLWAPFEIKTSCLVQMQLLLNCGLGEWKSTEFSQTEFCEKIETKSL